MHARHPSILILFEGSMPTMRMGVPTFIHIDVMPPPNQNHRNIYASNPQIYKDYTETQIKEQIETSIQILLFKKTPSLHLSLHFYRINVQKVWLNWLDCHLYDWRTSACPFNKDKDSLLWGLQRNSCSQPQGIAGRIPPGFSGKRTL